MPPATFVSFPQTWPVPIGGLYYRSVYKHKEEIRVYPRVYTDLPMNRDSEGTPLSFPCTALYRRCIGNFLSEMRPLSVQLTDTSLPVHYPGGAR